MRLYLSKHQERNQLLIESLEAYGIVCDTVGFDQLKKEDVLEWMRLSPDCFAFLTPTCLIYKRRDNLPFSQFLDIIWDNRARSLRLPLIVDKGHVYPDVTLEDLRSFLPRERKEKEWRALKTFLSV
ncbi:hypothetical protein HO924_04115 [Streptococcus suis]|nr:hypothetical protein [Streptococcus suis]NQP33754.1 hypothetical protein [Streptococcus suis]NQP36119.1 hypothetical protein [Streptococcus suis]